MGKLQKIILIVWCVVVTACLIYVPFRATTNSRTYSKMDYVWKRTDTIAEGWRIVGVPIVLKVAALTVVCGTACILTIKRREL